MALDSKGNPVVDYVWGNFPMQPNAERGLVSQDTVFNIGSNGNIYIQNTMDGSNKVVIYDMNAASSNFFTSANIKVGDVLTGNFSYNGVNPAKFTVTGVSTYMGMEGKYDYLYTDVAYTPAYSKQNDHTLSILDAANVGGGTGDRGWSKTTTRWSKKLDSALDGHIMATDVWNGFPGHNPNSGFPVYSYTVAQDYQVQISPDGVDVAGTGTRDGYIIRVYAGYPPVDTNAESLTQKIKDLKTAGEKVAAWNFKDSYANNWMVPEGFIVGADTTKDMYGNYNITIQVAVPNGKVKYVKPDGTTTNLNDTGSVYPVKGTEIVLGVGQPKEVLYEKGSDFGDFFAVSGTWDPYQGAPTIRVQLGNSPSTQILALADGRAVGGYVGIGDISEYTDPYGNNQYRFKTDFFKVGNVVLENGPSGEQSLRFYADVDFVNGFEYQGSVAYDYDGTMANGNNIQLVVIK